MTNNYLYFECRGMDDNKIPGDIKNHRVDIMEKIDIVFEGKPYKMFFEFTTGTRFNYRKTHKITGKPLKHVVKECINNNGLWIDTEYETPKTSRYFDEKERKWKEYTFHTSHRLSKLDRVAHDENMSFTKLTILKLINRYAIEKFTGVILIEQEAKTLIERCGGFREKYILKQDPVFRVSTWTKEHKCVEVVSRVKETTKDGWHYIDGDSCEVDLLTGRITG